MKKHTEEKPVVTSANMKTSKKMVRARRNSSHGRTFSAYEEKRSPESGEKQNAVGRCKVYNSRGLIEPLDLKPFLKSCYKKVANKDIMDLLFYCKFDFEKDLSEEERRAFEFEPDPHWLSILYKKWLEKRERVRQRLRISAKSGVIFEEVDMASKYKNHKNNIYKGSQMDKLSSQVRDLAS